MIICPIHIWNRLQFGFSFFICSVVGSITAFTVIEDVSSALVLCTRAHVHLSSYFDESSAVCSHLLQRRKFSRRISRFCTLQSTLGTPAMLRGVLLYSCSYRFWTLHPPFLWYVCNFVDLQMIFWPFTRSLPPTTGATFDCLFLVFPTSIPIDTFEYWQSSVVELSHYVDDVSFSVYAFSNLHSHVFLLATRGVCKLRLQSVLTMLYSSIMVVTLKNSKFKKFLQVKLHLAIYG